MFVITHTMELKGVISYMATANNMFLRSAINQNGISFEVKRPVSNAEMMKF